jgi:maleylpyruvate isomerase
MPTSPYTSPLELLGPVKDSTERLLATARQLDDEQLRQPSRLPGWTRAHVLTHLSRGADSRVRLLTAARTGADLPQYPSEEQRQREIIDGARRLRAELLADLRASAERLRQAIVDHPPECWGRRVCWLGDEERPVDDVVSSRLQELEIHHLDLDTGYGYRNWPGWFAAAELQQVAEQMRAASELDGVVLEVVETGTGYPFGGRAARILRGDAGGLLAWLIGRSDGTDLTAEPNDPLPHPPAWK